MALTRAQLRTMVINNLKVDTTDTAAIYEINSNLNIAIKLVAPKRNFKELERTNTVLLTASDGDTTYTLATDVDEVEQMRITSPQSYSRVLEYKEKTMHREIIPNKNIPGVAPPSWWYYSEPTVSSVNVATKTISFSYRPDQAYTITYSYKAFPPELDDDTKYPFFDSIYHHIPYYYAAWKYAERNAQAKNNPNYWKGCWEQALAGLLRDEQSQLTSPPQIPYTSDI